MSLIVVDGEDVQLDLIHGLGKVNVGDTILIKSGTHKIHRLFLDINLIHVVGEDGTKIEFEDDKMGIFAIEGDYCVIDNIEIDGPFVLRGKGNVIMNCKLPKVGGIYGD